MRARALPSNIFGVLTLAATLIAPFSVLRSQSARPCPREDGPVLLPCQVDRLPQPAPENAPPDYPAMLLAANIGGTIRAQFVLDTTGRPVARSFIFGQTSNTLFAQAVKHALTGWVFTPALRGGRRVAVRYEEEFVFALPRNSDMPPSAPTVLARDTALDGVPRMVLGRPDYDSTAAALYTDRDLLGAQRSVITTLAKEARRDSSRGRAVTLCVALRRDSVMMAPDPELLRELSQPDRLAVTMRSCPHTYQSMIAQVDSLGRPTNLAPPGWIDPYRLVIDLVKPWTREVVFVKASLQQGTGTHLYRCAANRTGAEWRATCKRWASMVE